MGTYEPMSEQEYFRHQRQITNLPHQVERLREKTKALEYKARRYGMTELLTNLEHVNRAWDKAILGAQEAVEDHGGDIGFGEAKR